MDVDFSLVTHSAGANEMKERSISDVLFLPVAPFEAQTGGAIDRNL